MSTAEEVRFDIFARGVHAFFNDDQPRDDHGRFGSGGTSDTAEKIDGIKVTGIDKLDATQRASFDAQIAKIPADVKAMLDAKGIKVAVVDSTGPKTGLEVGGQYDPSTRTVSIQPNTVVPDKDSLNAPTLLHEIAHGYDHAAGDISKESAFKALMKEAEPSKGSYFAKAMSNPFGGKTDPRQELFAEATAHVWNGTEPQVDTRGFTPIPADFTLTDNLRTLVEQLPSSKGFALLNALTFEFNEDQPRDDHGRFGSGGGGSSKEDSGKSLSVEDVRAWPKIPGPLGSQGGTWHRSPEGKEFLLKPTTTINRASNEIAAGAVYRAAGIPFPDTKMITDASGKPFILSEKIPDLEQRSGSWWNNHPEAQAKAAEGYGVDALLSHWDVLGLEKDNTLTTSDGTPVRIESGGAMGYRAMGGAKDSFAPGKEWGEPKSMRFGEQGQNLYGKMTDAQAADSLERAQNIDLGKVAQAWKDAGISTKDSAPWMKTLEERQAKIPGIVSRLRGSSDLAMLYRTMVFEACHMPAGTPDGGQFVPCDTPGSVDSDGNPAGPDSAADVAQTAQKAAEASGSSKAEAKAIGDAAKAEAEAGGAGKPAGEQPAGEDKHPGAGKLEELSIKGLKGTPNYSTITHALYHLKHTEKGVEGKEQAQHIGDKSIYGYHGKKYDYMVVSPTGDPKQPNVYEFVSKGGESQLLGGRTVDEAVATKDLVAQAQGTEPLLPPVGTPDVAQSTYDAMKQMDEDAAKELQGKLESLLQTPDEAAAQLGTSVDAATSVQDVATMAASAPEVLDPDALLSNAADTFATVEPDTNAQIGADLQGSPQENIASILEQGVAAVATTLEQGTDYEALGKLTEAIQTQISGASPIGAPPGAPDYANTVAPGLAVQGALDAVAMGSLTSSEAAGLLMGTTSLTYAQYESVAENAAGSAIDAVLSVAATDFNIDYNEMYDYMIEPYDEMLADGESQANAAMGALDQYMEETGLKYDGAQQAADAVKDAADTEAHNFAPGGLAEKWDQEDSASGKLASLIDSGLPYAAASALAYSGMTGEPVADIVNASQNGGVSEISQETVAAIANAASADTFTLKGIMVDALGVPEDEWANALADSFGKNGNGIVAAADAIQAVKYATPDDGSEKENAHIAEKWDDFKNEKNFNIGSEQIKEFWSKQGFGGMEDDLLKMGELIGMNKVMEMVATESTAGFVASDILNLANLAGASALGTIEDIIGAKPGSIATGNPVASLGAQWAQDKNDPDLNQTDDPTKGTSHADDWQAFLDNGGQPYQLYEYLGDKGYSSEENAAISNIGGIVTNAAAFEMMDTGYLGGITPDQISEMAEFLDAGTLNTYFAMTGNDTGMSGGGYFNQSTKEEMLQEMINNNIDSTIASSPDTPAGGSAFADAIGNAGTQYDAMKAIQDAFPNITPGAAGWLASATGIASQAGQADSPLSPAQLVGLLEGTVAPGTLPLNDMLANMSLNDIDSLATQLGADAGAYENAWQANYSAQDTASNLDILTNVLAPEAEYKSDAEKFADLPYGDDYDHLQSTLGLDDSQIEGLAGASFALKYSGAEKGETEQSLYDNKVKAATIFTDKSLSHLNADDINKLAVNMGPAELKGVALGLGIQPATLKELLKSEPSGAMPASPEAQKYALEQMQAIAAGTAPGTIGMTPDQSNGNPLAIVINAATSAADVAAKYDATGDLNAKAAILEQTGLVNSADGTHYTGNPYATSANVNSVIEHANYNLPAEKVLDVLKSGNITSLNDNDLYNLSKFSNGPLLAITGEGFKDVMTAQHDADPNKGNWHADLNKFDALKAMQDAQGGYQPTGATTTSAGAYPELSKLDVQAWEKADWSTKTDMLNAAGAGDLTGPLISMVGDGASAYNLMSVLQNGDFSILSPTDIEAISNQPTSWIGEYLSKASLGLVTVDGVQSEINKLDDQKINSTYAEVKLEGTKTMLQAIENAKAASAPAGGTTTEGAYKAAADIDKATFTDSNTTSYSQQAMLTNAGVPDDLASSIAQYVSVGLDGGHALDVLATGDIGKFDAKDVGVLSGLSTVYIGDFIEQMTGGAISQSDWEHALNNTTFSNDYTETKTNAINDLIAEKQAGTSSAAVDTSNTFGAYGFKGVGNVDAQNFHDGGFAEKYNALKDAGVIDEVAQHAADWANNSGVNSGHVLSALATGDLTKLDHADLEAILDTGGLKATANAFAEISGGHFDADAAETAALIPNSALGYTATKVAAFEEGIQNAAVGQADEVAANTPDLPTGLANENMQANALEYEGLTSGDKMDYLKDKGVDEDTAVTVAYLSDEGMDPNMLMKMLDDQSFSHMTEAEKAVMINALDAHTLGNFIGQITGLPSTAYAEKLVEMAQANGQNVGFATTSLKLDTLNALAMQTPAQQPPPGVQPTNYAVGGKALVDAVGYGGGKVTSSYVEGALKDLGAKPEHIGALQAALTIGVHPDTVSQIAQNGTVTGISPTDAKLLAALDAKTLGEMLHGYAGDFQGQMQYAPNGTVGGPDQPKAEWLLNEMSKGGIQLSQGTTVQMTDVQAKIAEIQKNDPSITYAAAKTQAEEALSPPPAGGPPAVEINASGGKVYGDPSVKVDTSKFINAPPTGVGAVKVYNTSPTFNGSKPSLPNYQTMQKMIDNAQVEFHSGDGISSYQHGNGVISMKENADGTFGVRYYPMGKLDPATGKIEVVQPQVAKMAAGLSQASNAVLTGTGIHDYTDFKKAKQEADSKVLAKQAAENLKYPLPDIKGKGAGDMPVAAKHIGYTQKGAGTTPGYVSTSADGHSGYYVLGKDDKVAVGRFEKLRDTIAHASAVQHGTGKPDGYLGYPASHQDIVGFTRYQMKDGVFTLYKNSDGKYGIQFEKGGKLVGTSEKIQQKPYATGKVEAWPEKGGVFFGHEQTGLAKDFAGNHTQAAAWGDEKYGANGGPKNYSTSEWSALKSYGDGGYGTINSALRNPGGYGSQTGIAKAIAIDQAMLRTPTKEPITVYRGFSDGHGSYATQIINAPEGTLFRDRAFMSTSVSSSSAFSGTVTLKIDVPEGVPSVFKPGNQYPHEAELLLPSNTTLEKTGPSYYENGRTIVPVRVVAVKAEPIDIVSAIVAGGGVAPQIVGSIAEQIRRRLMAA